MYFKVVQQDNDQNARTPPVFLKVMQRMYFHGHRIHDPCPPNHTVDGLVSEWKAQNFVNPPFGEAALWIAKAISQSKKHSVMFLPAKLSNASMYHMLPHVTSIVLWCNVFRFVGYSRSFPFGMCTIEFGKTTLSPSSSTDVQLRRVPADAWRFSNLTTVDRVKARVERHYGVMPECTLDTMPASGKAFLVIRRENQNTMTEIAKHCRTYTNASIIVLARLAFEAKFRTLENINDLVQHILILSPSVSMDNICPSRVTSLVVCMSTKPTKYRYPELKAMPTVWLARYTKEHIVA